MKLIVAGATGFVGSEVLRQALRLPDVTTVVALTRRPVTAPEGADASKFRNTVIEDFSSSSEDTLRELAGANAVVWAIGLTPGKIRGRSNEEIRRTCLDFTTDGIKAIHDAGPATALRFIYVSGIAIPRDPNKKSLFFADYVKLRSDVERAVLKYAADSNGAIDACIAKPGWITGENLGVRTYLMNFVRATGITPNVRVEEIAAALLDQVLHGFEKEPLNNDDLVRIGRKILGTAK